jgi:hypothetical protein
MATVPLSGTDIRLLSGIPFTNDYKNTRWFDTITNQTAYFNSKPVVHSIVEANFQRIEGYNFIAVNKSIDELWNTNYLMFRNTSYNNKWFYAFITKLEYKNRGLTYVHFQIDVFQTWKFEMDFKPSYVVREHCKLWATDGTPIVNTVDEALHYGTDYDTVSVEKYVPFNDIYFLVIVTKSLMHDREVEKAKDIYPTINTLPQPLNYYVHPIKLDGTDPIVWDGTEAIVLSKPLKLLENLYKMDDAVNNIVSLYITDYIGVNLDFTDDVLTMPTDKFVNVSMHDLTDPENNLFVNTVFVKDIKNYQPKEKNFGSKWNGYDSVTESKLMMYPYTQLVLDDFKGNRVTLRNEHIYGNELKVLVKGSLGTSNKVSYGVKWYNFNGSVYDNTFENQLSDEATLINNEPNDIPIVTDMLSAYLQGNRNSLQNQKNSIIFNGIANAVGGIANTAGGAITGGAIGGVGGAIAGGFGGAVSTVQGAGNAVLQMQGLQAKQKDIDNTPPAMSKMGSNTAYSVGNGYNGLYVIKKQIKPEYRKKLSDFFKMFGYKVNEVKTPNFHTRNHWNYVQTSACTITGNFNNDDLNELKNIFDQGITLWHTDDVGNYSLENGVI